MCIVIDINTLPSVFNETCKKQEDFKPVREWVNKGLGFVVYGGTRYKKELSSTYRYLRLIRQMKDSGHAVAIRDDVVDAAETCVLGQTTRTTCDDQHIIALLGTSRCPLFCSDDTRSYKYIKDKGLYPKGMVKVRIYSSKKNQQLLKPMTRDMLKNQA
jgi:hypothetical protein